MPRSKNPRKKKTSSASALLFDANVWVALAFADHPHHQLAVTLDHDFKVFESHGLQLHLLNPAT